ncbi:sporulation-delaying protein SdpB family protein [Hymenobacter chitinivorans]|uniref:Antimicrobial peptide system SdpB family protein n=1 Tax=Hymenobacter chitinivorans DSM 11115 TaxID=1121954 RepID=A0A2M9BMM6_9BACT|nr:sporulation-delaying protein SdpB family protein [Hymenobacter chitinivorans]PJJ59213.1 antimicrobial peptide system SdpB family protein [Hymenobacter chitinivorans DSM 11115]
MYKNTLRALDSYASVNPFTWVYGLGRSLIALGTLITLLLSSPAVLFDQQLFGKMSLDASLESFNIFFLFGFEHLNYAYALSIVVLLVVISGVFPRYTGILHWIVTYSFFQSGSIVEGGDQIGSIITMLLVPVTLLDGRKNHWINVPQANPNYYANFIARGALALIALQMAVLYFHAGIEKMYKLDEWKNGTAVYYFFNDPLFGYPDWMHSIMASALTNAYIVTSLTWGTMIFEVSLFGALFMAPQQRKKLIWLAVGFHLGIALIFGLVSFFCAMAGGLVLYMIPVETKIPVLRGRRTGTMQLVSRHEQPQPYSSLEPATA